MSGSSSVILPFAALVVGAFLEFILARFLKLSNLVEALLTALVLAIALMLTILLIPSWFTGFDVFFGELTSGGVIFKPNVIGTYIILIGLILGILICLFSGKYLSRDSRYLVYYPLIVLSLAGLFGMFLTRDLFNLFLLTELTTITASALIGFRYQQEASIRAGFKYLIMSSLGSMVMLLGIYFVYRGSGDLRIPMKIVSTVNDLTRIGSACFFLGFSLKAGIFPLHTWVPEVYSQAPSAVSGFLAGVLSKSMLFFIPGICLGLGMEAQELGIIMVIFAGLNMLVGVIRALNQREVRRFLSYASITQTGYLMFILGLGVYYNHSAAYSAGLFLFMGEAVMTCLVFLSAGVYEYHLNVHNILDLQGVNRVMPTQSLCFSIGLAGLAGIPLLAGFTGKWLVFSAAIEAGGWVAWVGLVVFLVSTLIGLGGYLPVIQKQYNPGRKLEPKNKVAVPAWLSVPVLLLTIIVVVLGVYPGPWIAIIEKLMAWWTL